MYALKGYSQATATPVKVNVLKTGQQSFRSAAWATVQSVANGEEFTVPQSWLFEKPPRLTQVEDQYGTCTVWI